MVSTGIPSEGPSALCDCNWLDQAVSIEASRETGNLGADRLMIERLSKRYRCGELAPGDTRHYVRIDFGAPRPVRRIFWQRLRRPQDRERKDPSLISFASSDIVRHRLSTTDAHDGDVYDSQDIQSDIVDGVGVHDHLVPVDGLGAVRLAQFAMFEFDALSRDTYPFNFVDWGRAWYADQWDFTFGYRAPFRESWRDASTATRTYDGSSEVVDRIAINWREVSVSFGSVKYAEEHTDLVDFLNRTGRRNRFLFCQDGTAANPRGTFIARNTTPQIDRINRALDRFDLQLVESL